MVADGKLTLEQINAAKADRKADVDNKREEMTAPLFRPLINIIRKQPELRGDGENSNFIEWRKHFLQRADDMNVLRAIKGTFDFEVISTFDNGNPPVDNND